MIELVLTISNSKFDLLKYFKTSEILKQFYDIQSTKFCLNNQMDEVRLLGLLLYSFKLPFMNYFIRIRHWWAWGGQAGLGGWGVNE